jgi:hypothetical protein
MLIIVWIVAIVISGILADRYKRNTAGWVICGVLIGFLAPLILLALGEDKTKSFNS